MNAGQLEYVRLWAPTLETMTRVGCLRMRIALFTRTGFWQEPPLDPRVPRLFTNNTTWSVPEY